MSLPVIFETGLVGVFAAGDVRSGSVKRGESAVEEGTMAIRQIHESVMTGAWGPSSA